MPLHSRILLIAFDQRSGIKSFIAS